MVEIKDLEGIATLLRRDVLEMTTSAGSGHPTSCLSAADLVSALFFKVMKYDIHKSDNPDNDEFVLSKGHAAPLLYSALKRAGCIRSELSHLRKLRSPLEGHPMPLSLQWIKVATGSLGQGLSVGLGMSLAAKMQKRKSKTFVLLGDSECAEGQVWEAAQLASHYNLDNLIVIVDVNSLGQQTKTILGYDLASYKKRFESFGWQVSLINGHNIKQILSALETKTSKPHVIIAETKKGKGVPFIENEPGWHGKSLSGLELQKALKELPVPDLVKIHINHPEKTKPLRNISMKLNPLEYNPNEKYSTREAYGESLRKVFSSNSYALALDCEVSNSTFADKIKKDFPSRFYEMYIAEQNMISAALGLAVKGHRVFASTFSAFLTRAHDQLRMAALSGASFVVCGSHSGSSIGEDGASQMGLDDIAMFRALPGSTVLYPSDAISTEKLVELAAKNHSGINYIRTTRGKTPILYKKESQFSIGDFGIIGETNEDKIVLAGAGITLHEAISAADSLKEKNISVAVIDIYCIKPFNAEKFKEFVQTHGNKLVIAEDHYKEGGIGEMLSAALAGTKAKITHLSVNKIPHSATPEEELIDNKIDSKYILESANELLR